ncbi:hypothetical protein [Sphingobacterium lumbrici]|uniref:hypothetical protein n=1 Tax=Sphingobacterium lumbrici TaxID=2559600 RepID=UPI00112769B9|nr:hypothetical protein [Sphingobacterium lumbrici]
MCCNSIQTDAPRILNDTLVSQFNIASNGFLAFVNFKKIDGIEYQDGSLRYKLIYSGFVEATKDCYWNGNILTSGRSYMYSEDDEKGWPMGISKMKIAETIEEINAMQWYGGLYKHQLYKKAMDTMSQAMLFLKREIADGK